MTDDGGSSPSPICHLPSPGAQRPLRICPLRPAQKKIASQALREQAEADFMKARLTSLALTLALISFSGVRAEETKPAVAPPPAAKAEKPETELEQTMGKMSKAWREVRKQDKEGKLNPATASLVETMRVNAEAALKLTPEMEADKPAADRAKFHADYQAQMKKMIGALGRLEAALKANDIPAATKLIGEVKDVQKEGHHDFKKPDEKK
jgi:soluble cytochrome b562